MIIDDEILIRRIVDSDVPLLAELYDRVWPEDAGLHYAKTKWAVETCEISGVCAEFRGALIASRSCFHSNIYVGEEHVTSVQLGDSCVDESFRGKGLFSLMNKFFMEAFFKTKDEIVFNISVEASRIANEKQGWRYISSLQKLYHINNIFSFLWKTKGNIKRLSGVLKVESSPIPDIYVIPDYILDLHESLLSKKQIIHTKYDFQTLKWRMGTHSGIRLLYDTDTGVCLYKVGVINGLRVCVLGDCFLKQYETSCFKSLIRLLKKSVRADVYETAICYSHPLYKFYRSSGFHKNPLKVFLNLGVKVLSQKMKDICFNPDNWALTNLDLDTF